MAILKDPIPFGSSFTKGESLSSSKNVFPLRTSVASQHMPNLLQPGPPENSSPLSLSLSLSCSVLELGTLRLFMAASAKDMHIVPRFPLVTSHMGHSKHLRQHLPFTQCQLCLSWCTNSVFDEQRCVSRAAAAAYLLSNRISTRIESSIRSFFRSIECHTSGQGGRCPNPPVHTHDQSHAMPHFHT